VSPPDFEFPAHLKGKMFTAGVDVGPGQYEITGLEHIFFADLFRFSIEPQMRIIAPDNAMKPAKKTMAVMVLFRLFNALCGLTGRRSYSIVPVCGNRWQPAPRAKMIRRRLAGRLHGVDASYVVRCEVRRP
jgi:hypothetical protein